MSEGVDLKVDAPVLYKKSEAPITSSLRQQDTLGLPIRVLDLRSNCVTRARASSHVHRILQSLDATTKYICFARILRTTDQFSQRKQWIHLVPLRFRIEQCFHLRQLLRIFCGEIGRLAV